MSKIITEVQAYDLMSQLGKERVVEYEAENETITTIVTDLLNFQVLTPPITIGTISGSYSGLTRSIKVDGDTILRALFRLRDTVGGYIYVDNDRKLQWTDSLGEDKGQQIRYKKNLNGIERSIDYNSLVNRLYCYGAGEGTARIKLSDAAGQTEDYVEDTTSQTKWGGVYVGVKVDKSITHPDTLFAWANLKLAEVKDPIITYQINTVDLSESNEADFSFESLQLGSIVKVIDEELGIDVETTIVKIEHPDLLHPEQMNLELSTRTKDITDTLLEVYDRQQFDQHIATTIGAGQVVVKGAFTVQDWVTGGETTIEGSNIRTGTISLNRLDFIPLSSSGATGDVIATINASTEGLTIDANKISVNVGKSIFKQDTIPTSIHTGDLWFDTNDNNKLYRAACIGADQITAGEWELVRDSQINTNASNITQNADNISTNVTSINTANGKITTNESNISQNADDINLRVKENDVINQINISTEGILIDADNIRISGSTTFDSGYDPTGKIPSGGAAADVNAGTTTIDGGKITANSLTLVDVATDFDYSSIGGTKPPTNADHTADNTAKDIVNLPATVGAAGLYANGTYLGYSDGSAWKTYMDNNGRFYLSGSGGDYLSWNGSALTVSGTIYINNPANIDALSLSNAPAEAGADATANNPQDYSWVSGTKPPSNADVTLSALNGGLVVTGGGITLSNGGAIKGGQTDYDTGTGFFLGYSSDYKFSIGNPSGSKLTWNGSDLSIRGTLEACSLRTNTTNTNRIEITSGVSQSGEAWQHTTTDYDVLSFLNGSTEYAYIKGYQSNSSLNIYSAGPMTIQSGVYGMTADNADTYLSGVTVHITSSNAVEINNDVKLASGKGLYFDTAKIRGDTYANYGFSFYDGANSINIRKKSGVNMIEGSADGGSTWHDLW